MGASFPKKFWLKVAAALSGSGKPRPEGFMSRRFLYRRLVCAVIVILVGGIRVPRSAGQDLPQLKRPQEDNAEQKPAEMKTRKKVKGPRAVGLLQLSDGKATLIPVAILVEGKFYDASVYRADPVPMALDRGTVYEVEQVGESQGLFTTNGALHSKSASSVNPWMATGSYLPNGTEAAKTTHKAEDVPEGLNAGGDEPPRLTRKSAAASKPTPASTTSASAGGTGSSEKTSGSAGEGKGSPAGGSGKDDAKTATPAADASADQSGKKPPAQPSAGQASQSQESGNYYRPTLRRGKPTQGAPVEEEPTTKVVATASPTGAGAVISAKPVQVLPAISDAGGPEPQSYKFFWKEGEEEERRKQMLTLAGDEVRAYVSARAKGAIGVKPATSSEAGVARRKAAVKPAQPVFENIQFQAFDVWKNNQPVMILTAEARLPETGTASASEAYSITLVSRTDIYGSLRKLYSGVTDRFHLDVTPRLELIDAVDADGDGRGELLFRETTDGRKGYVIYRPTGDKLWKMFDSLGT